MSRPLVTPTRRERFFEPDEIIVSKTDPKGVITYANSVFLRIAGYTEDEILGQSHNIVRHPDMPRCVFKLLWDTIAAGKEIFAYVLNMAKEGDHYWVFAHVTPTFDADNHIIGYHSNRRVPEAGPKQACAALYQLLLAEEKKHSSPKDGIEASLAMMTALLKDKGIGYDEFVFSL